MIARASLKAHAARLGVCLALGCSGTAGSVRPPQRVQLAPATEAERHTALEAFARKLFEAAQTRSMSSLIFDDIVLRNLLTSVAASRASTLHHNRVPIPATAAAVLRTAQFRGACIQGLREEPAATVVGLLEPAWYFDRILLVGQEPTGRIAFWVEGEFVWTDAGFGAIAILDSEMPRRDHADLELAVCDVDLDAR